MIRIDKWLWAARFFKTRALAQQAIEGGKVRLNGERTKPAKEVKISDQLAINIGGYEWAVQILKLSAQRGPASVAQQLYQESDESRAQRALEAAKRCRVNEPASTIKGRPTKRDRRVLERWREGE